MDSNSNSSDGLLPKLEIAEENDDIFNCSFSRKQSRPHWNTENTMKLIELFEKECPELWNVNHSTYKDRMARHGRFEYLAVRFDTTTEEITRKLHNLRTQYNNEMRKIKKKQGEGVAANSGWDYFEALSFLKQPCNDSMSDPLDMSESVNIELAEFQVKEEEVFAAARARLQASTSTSPSRPRKPTKVAASAPPRIPDANFMWTEQPWIQPGQNTDECQIFGDFVASELRALRSGEARKKLKRMIQKAILEVGAEEDTSSRPSHSSWDMD